MEGNVRRAIDIQEGEAVDEAAFKTLVRQAVALNSAGKVKKTTKQTAKTAAPPKAAKTAPPAKGVKTAKTAAKKTAKKAAKK